MPRSGGENTAFRRVAQELRDQIRANVYSPDVPVPTEAELAQKHGVSRQTVRRAFQEIVNEGLVYRIPGKGTFVTQTDGYYLRQIGSIEDLMALSYDSEMSVVSPLQDVIDPLSAGRLQLSNDRVSAVIFLRLYEGRPFCYTIVSLAPSVAVLIPADSPVRVMNAHASETVIGLLRPLLSVPIRTAEQSISVADPPREVREALELTPDRATLRIDRLYIDEHENPVEAAVTYFHPDRYSYRVRLDRT